MPRPCIFVPKRHADARGWFAESFREDRLQDVGITCHFVQDNQSNSKQAGTLRGLHFQLPPAAQAKLVSVVRGRILDVAVDLRRGSPTYGNHVAVELSAESGHQLYIPVGYAHGLLTLESDVVVTYKVTNYYAPKLDSGIRWDDQDIAIQWPWDSRDLTISEKDRLLPSLKEFVSPFIYDAHPLEPLTKVELG